MLALNDERSVASLLAQSGPGRGRLPRPPAAGAGSARRGHRERRRPRVVSVSRRRRPRGGRAVDDLIGVLIGVAATIGSARVVTAAPTTGSGGRDRHRRGDRCRGRIDFVRSPREDTADRALTAHRPYSPVASSDGGCCSPSRTSSGGPGAAVASGVRTSPRSTDGMVSLAGGVFVMGSEDRFAYAADGETRRQVEVSSVHDRLMRGVQCRVRRVCRRDRIRHTSRTIRVVVRVRLAAPARLRRHAVGGCCAWWRQAFGVDWADPEGLQLDLDRSW